MLHGNGGELELLIKQRYGIVEEPPIVENDDHIEEEEMDPCRLLKP